MAAPYNPPKKGEDFIFYIALKDLSKSSELKANPSIAAGDFKVSIDDGALNNLATTPSVSPASSIWVKVTLSTSEMNGDNIKLQGIDQTNPKEWADYALDIITTQ